jgi:hypothetical protein
VLHAVVPRIAQIVMNTTFRMFPDSDRGQGRQGGGQAAAQRRSIAIQQLMRGIHF